MFLCVATPASPESVALPRAWVSAERGLYRAWLSAKNRSEERRSFLLGHVG